MNTMNWAAIYPEIILLAMACVVALVDLFVADPLRRPTYWLTQLTLVVFGDGVDGQVAADQVVFQAHVGAGMEGEPAIATAALAFGAGEGVFLAALRVQEHREIRPHGTKAFFQHLLGTGADHHPIDFRDGSAEQPVAHGSTHFIDLHACLLEHQG